MPRLPYKAKPAARRPRGKTRTSITVIGTGMIGASIGLAARAAGFDVVGWDASLRAARGARNIGAVTTIAASLEEAIASSAIVILCAPLDQVLLLLPKVFAHARPRALVMDVAGVKAPVENKAHALLRKRRDIRFIAGHPIAGSERSGPAAADAMLFHGRAFALYAPPQESRKQAYAVAERLVRALGAIPLRISPRVHDRAIAALSALPQLTSIALVLAADDCGAHRGRRLAGPGYRDATRLAASGFAMWKPVLAANLKNTRASVRALSKRVSTLERALRRRDWAALERLFAAAARARRRVNPA